MKKPIKIFSVLALCTFMALGTYETAFAQEDNRTTAQADDNDDDDTDWGWVGLIGLAGLLGLRGKDRDDRDRDVRVRTTNDPRV